MAANLAMKEEFTVGWGFYPNNKNIVQQNSCGCESLHSEKTALTPLSTLTTAPYGAQTLVLSGFQGGGGQLLKPAPRNAFSHIIQNVYCSQGLKNVKDLSSYSLNVFKRNTS